MTIRHNFQITTNIAVFEQIDLDREMRWRDNMPLPPVLPVAGIASF
jgi:hypothetical protein